MEKTTIQISDKLWKKLIKQRQRGETFEDVLWRHIKTHEKKEVEKNANRI